MIIDKLPFTSPDDPLLKARMEDCRLRGGDPFDEVQLPDAVITLKQGVGRLIRDIDDRGVRGDLRQPAGDAPLRRGVPGQSAAGAANPRYPSGGALSRRTAGKVIRTKMC